MKVRIYYKGYKNQYLCQYSKWGIWRNFQQWCGGGDGGYGIDRGFSTFDAAREWLSKEQATYVQEKAKEVAAKERAKKSGVVFYETW